MIINIMRKQRVQSDESMEIAWTTPCKRLVHSHIASKYVDMDSESAYSSQQKGALFNNTNTDAVIRYWMLDEVKNDFSHQ